MKKGSFIGFVLVMFLLTACTKDKEGFDEVKYKVTFNGNWIPGLHDSTTTYPSNAHFSPLIGLSHAESFEMFTSGQKASPGIVLMAETGQTGVLNKELAEVSGNSPSVFVFDGGIGSGTGIKSHEIELVSNESFVSLVSMIAPSPDWFVAVKGVNLKGSDGQWLKNKKVQVKIYDSGSDSGVSFTSADQKTSPQEVIASLSSLKFNSSGKVIDLAEVSFDLIE